MSEGMLSANAASRVHAALSAVIGPEQAAQALASHDIVGDAHLDSFALMQFTAELEVEFGIVIPLDRLVPENFRSLDAIVELCTCVVRPQ